MKPINLKIGAEYERLTVLGLSFMSGKRRWKCRCKCGNITYQKSSDLRSGSVVSCGCYASEKNSERCYKHGWNNTPEQKAWENMKSRCYNRNTPYWKHYGGRGIRVCKRWRKSFMKFLSDVGPRPGKGFTLDRIDNDGNYEPGNVRWTTQRQQMRNLRITVKLTIDGITKSIAEWSEESGVHPATIKARIQVGRDPKSAVFDRPQRKEPWKLKLKDKK